MKTMLLIAVLVLVATAGCGATISFSPVDGGYYSPPPVVYYPPPVVYYPNWWGPQYHYGVMCSRYQGCTHYW